MIWTPKHKVFAQFELIFEGIYRFFFFSSEILEQVDRKNKALHRNNKRQKTESNAQEEREIKEDLKRALELSDEKLALAAQTYEVVDKHIRRLDADLKKFEAELESQGQRTDLKTLAELQEKKDTPSSTSSQSDNGKVSGHKRKSVTPAELGATPAPSQSTSDARVHVVDIDMPIDPNEPTYCICGRVRGF